jgi:hypothetical protein
VFSDITVNWEGSLGSDHVCLRIKGRTQPAPPPPPDNSNAGYVVDPEMKEEWIKHYKSSPPHLVLPLTPTAEEVEQAVAELFDNIQEANEKTFCRRQPTHPKAAPWWNSDCAMATRAVRSTRAGTAHKAALKQLKKTVRAAKRKWADEYIENGKLWDVANWRHGRRITKVPSLHGPEGIVHVHEEVAGVLSQRFFAKTPPSVEARFHDDPPSLPTRRLPSISKEFIEPLLQKATARSAPGQSGHTWTIIKWAWEVDTEHIVELFEACLAAGHHATTPNRGKRQ